MLSENVIAHNHLWEAKTTWNEDAGLVFTDLPVLQKGYGDKRHIKVTDQKSRRSKILGINMFPIRVWRRDAYIAVKVVAKGLGVIESMDRRYFPCSQNFLFQRKNLPFDKVADVLSLPEDV